MKKRKRRRLVKIKGYKQHRGKSRHKYRPSKNGRVTRRKKKRRKRR